MNAKDATLTFTGERFLPGLEGEIWMEHWQRYLYAANYVRGLTVLDVACGEGYGSAWLARQAAQVIGVDLSVDAIAHAKSVYSAQPNLHFQQADCTALPFADASFDRVVSFETIEHITAQAQFLAELSRVLRPDGVLILSSPNKAEYSDRRGFANEYHVRELYREELQTLVNAHFPHHAWLGQKNGFFCLIQPESASAESTYLEMNKSGPDSMSRALSRPLYDLVFASRVPLPFVPAGHVLADSEAWLYEDYRTVTQDARKLHRLYSELHAEHAKLATHLNTCNDEIATLRARLQQDQTESAKALAERNALLHAEQQRSECMTTLANQRASIRWWLALPWYRLRCWLSGRPPLVQADEDGKAGRL